MESIFPGISLTLSTIELNNFFAASLPLAARLTPQVPTLVTTFTSQVHTFEGKFLIKFTTLFTKLVPTRIALDTILACHVATLVTTLTKNVQILDGNCLIKLIILLMKLLATSLALAIILLRQIITLVTTFTSQVQILDGKSLTKLMIAVIKLVATSLALAIILFRHSITLVTVLTNQVQIFPGSSLKKLTAVSINCGNVSVKNLPIALMAVLHPLLIVSHKPIQNSLNASDFFHSNTNATTSAAIAATIKPIGLRLITVLRTA